MKEQEKRERKNLNKNIMIPNNTKGITLISLVVTIIILLILAGVTVATLMGDNGLINKTKDAKIKTEIAGIKEEIQTDILGKQAENNGNISDDSLKEILEKYGTLSEEEKLADKTLTTTKGNYEIKVSDIFNETTVKDVPKNPTFTTVANAPDTTGFNKSNTYYVAWDLNEVGTEYIPNEIQMESENGTKNSAPGNWYDYTQGVNHWANVKTTGGENDCYWVWIPRYAYCITEGYNSNTAGTIDIKFLKETTNTPIDGSSITISNSSGSGNWNVHPAFWWDKNNNGVEDEGEQLTGIWVAKFEASSNNVSVATVETDLATTGGGDTNSLQVRVIPNVTSWRGIKVNNMFTVCRNLTQTGNSLENTTNLNSHMMKNIEWGACVYLSRSVYGKNGEVWNNQYYNNTTNYSPITGLCGNKTNGKDNATTNMSNTIKYNEIGGGNASTTGNVYGIYDMAGGAWEYVAGIYTAGASNDDRSKLWDSNNSKYVDKYTNTTDSQSTYYGNTDKYGDAVYETSSYGNSDTDSWDSSYSSFPVSDYPVFRRGGRADLVSSAGVFAFIGGTGVASGIASFRPVVLSSQP